MNVRERERRFKEWKQVRAAIDSEEEAIMQLFYRCGARPIGLSDLRISRRNLIAFMQAAFKEAAKDQKRMDFIEKHFNTISHEASKHSTRYYFRRNGGQTYREWIDEERAKYQEMKK